MLALLYLLLHTSCSIEGGNIQGTADKGTLDLGILIPWSGEWKLGPSMGAAVGLGVQEVERRRLLPGYNVSWEWFDTHCKARLGLKAALSLWEQTPDLDAFIGGGCSVVCKPVALVAAAWDLPYVSFGCSSDVLSQKFEYPTFSRSVGTYPSLAPMFRHFAQWLEWDRLAIITSTESIMQITANAVKTEFGSSGFDVIFRTIETTAEGDSVTNQLALRKLENILISIKDQARIFLLLMYDTDIANLLHSALEEDMLNGEYLFITLDTKLPNMDTVDTPIIYEGLVSANLREPQSAEWDVFAQKVIDEFQNESKFAAVDHLSKDADLSEVDVHAGMLHDAILMWAYGVNRSLLEGGTVDDGINITRNIFNLTFEGITGKVAINSLGDRMNDYTLAIAQHGQFVPLLNWFAADERLEKVYGDEADPDDWAGIIWAGNRDSPPTGRPLCGWSGELCENENAVISGQIAAPVAMCFAFIIGASIFLWCYRKMKFEADLKSVMTWRVEWDEVKHTAILDHTNFSMASVRSYGSLAEHDKRIGTKIATYKGKLVTVRKVKKESVNIHDRDILLEIKQMRDMSDENINPFIGACPSAPHISILMSYARKGSLQDVLQNDSINLTWDFKMSIATDIAKGMQYLHRSAFQSHGHLTSSNCVIDSRWTCKITDYGLAKFKSGAKIPSDEILSDDGLNYAPHITPESASERTREAADLNRNSKNSMHFLWTAPELLRMSRVPDYGTQKGDVFSFGIILQEIILKAAPYAANGILEPKEIIEKVVKGATPPFRPVIPRDACDHRWSELLSDCWQEEAARRPDFCKIRSILRALNGGKAINVIDNMISMLEQHAEHLQDLIAERTTELEAEKKKVENLLYNILPKSVADQLKHGGQVDPETFDSVTIYFSDIVGFTSIAAASTPLQVVTMLNSLYSKFDEVTDKYDVYKVETIGDAYMVVSGLPERNMSRHASEVATMSLHLLSSISVFHIPRLTHTHLQLRIGLHTGPCVAGVVGLKMPRYCLFGDTVNTASRMESSGTALRIHISSSTAHALNKSHDFSLSPRGTISVKGKGEMKTYWLEGKKGFNLPLPDRSKAAALGNHQFK